MTEGRKPLNSEIRKKKYKREKKKTGARGPGASEEGRAEGDSTDTRNRIS